MDAALRVAYRRLVVAEEIAPRLPLLHQRVPPANHITVTTAQLVPGLVIIGPQALTAIRQRYILATLLEHATQLTTARHAIPTSFHRVPPTPSRGLIMTHALMADAVSTRLFTSSSQSP